MSKNKSETQDEIINGAKVVANILKAMPTNSRDRLLEEIKNKEPSLSIKIQDEMFNFNDITTLSAKGVQTLIASIDQKDLVYSLKTASLEVKEFLFNNMTERKLKMVKEDFELLGKIKFIEVEDAQRRILRILDELRANGLITTNDSKGIWV